jgi:hypothetical protein
VPAHRVQDRVAHDDEREYSVTFDEPQHDADGPYRNTVIWERYLEVL